MRVPQRLSEPVAPGFGVARRWVERADLDLTVPQVMEIAEGVGAGEMTTGWVLRAYVLQAELEAAETPKAAHGTVRTRPVRHLPASREGSCGRLGGLDSPDLVPSRRFGRRA